MSVTSNFPAPVVLGALDTLESDSIVFPLSANQGRLLNEKIEALDSVASSMSFEATLLATNWAESDGVITQTLNIEGLLEAHNGIVSVAAEATAEARTCAREALLVVVEQSDGALVMTVDGDIPKLDIPVSIVILG